MINKIKVTNYLNQSLTLELGRPEKSGFLVRNITGIGASVADINMTDLLNEDGSVYNSARTTPRNIVLSLKFVESPTIEAVRLKSYKFFPSKKPVTLMFETNDRKMEIVGYVESNNPDIFSKDCGTQVSIICPDPNFYSTSSQTTMFSGLTHLFEFPFSNESLTEPLLEVSEVLVDEVQTVLYTGDSEVGVVIRIVITGTVSELKIFNMTTNQSMFILDEELEKVVGSGLIAKDEIIISTVRNDKYITLIRDGVRYNILGCVNPEMTWFQLSQGDNVFAYTAELGAANIHFTLDNKVAYQGV